MENNLFDYFYFAEFILTIGTLIILIIALFLKKNVFEKISSLVNSTISIGEFNCY